MSAPGSCPPWCDRHYPAAPASHTAARWMGPISVMLVQAPGHKPRLALSGALIELSEAELLAAAMSRLGHEDIATAIAELADQGDPDVLRPEDTAYSDRMVSCRKAKN